jgi:hypothetical protein
MLFAHHDKNLTKGTRNGSQEIHESKSEEPGETHRKRGPQGNKEPGRQEEDRAQAREESGQESYARQESAEQESDEEDSQEDGEEGRQEGRQARRQEGSAQALQEVEEVVTEGAAGFSAMPYRHGRLACGSSGARLLIAPLIRQAHHEDTKNTKWHEEVQKAILGVHATDRQ